MDSKASISDIQYENSHSTSVSTEQNDHASQSTAVVSRVPRCFSSRYPCFSCSQFKNYNPAFTQIEIWFRLIFLLTTFGVMVIRDSK